MPGLRQVGARPVVEPLGVARGEVDAAVASWAAEAVVPEGRVERVGASESTSRRGRLRASTAARLARRCPSSTSGACLGCGGGPWGCGSSAPGSGFWSARSRRGHVARLLPFVGHEDLVREVDVDPALALAHLRGRRARLDHQHVRLANERSVSDDQVDVSPMRRVSAPQARSAARGAHGSREASLGRSRDRPSSPRFGSPPRAGPSADRRASVPGSRSILCAAVRLAGTNPFCCVRQ